MSQPTIVAEGLAKRFGAVRALDGIDLEVEEGSILGLLGPNGAGKTTTIRILATLLRPDAGRASVGGYDVVRNPGEVRRLIGLTGQYAAVDELLSGHENLFMIARLLGIPKAAARGRATDLLEQFDLADAATKTVKTYSGGMRRRLDLAASLVGHPRFLYLDEPTTGLDPRSRRQVWEMITRLVGEGTTVLLTTQYLDEADHLCDRIAVMDHGKVVAAGTPDALKEKVGGRVVEVRTAEAADIFEAATVLKKLAKAEPTVHEDAQLISVPIAETAMLSAAARRLDRAGIAVAELALRRPSLDEVFLALTGHPAEQDGAADDASGHAGRSRS
ncbi:MAG: ATP-binding cassette domain-containing protein [Actinomycetota bacterium]